MKTRMQPIGQVWSKMPRVVRDLSHQARSRGRVWSWTATRPRLDRSLLEAVKDPLTHLVRNSLDHGIEPPRRPYGGRQAGQGNTQPAGVPRVRAGGRRDRRRRQGHRPRADRRGGAGARRRDPRANLSRMDAREVLGLIFRPGFSTAAAVSNISGRGVGMDVVRTNIERIGGSVDVASEPGRGTTTRVRIPLTLAIIPALVVGEGVERYAIPQANLVELVRIEGEDLQRRVEDLAGAPVLRLRGKPAAAGLAVRRPDR
ncbi:ATP-binding protein [Nocardioides convexus]|uniref:ATP-binding protein n=1 Tax=Nocardioides convexus TaxID=2712224 RepID=UPI0031018679